MKILITGGHGQLGRCLQDRLACSLHDFYAPGKHELDISAEASVNEIIEHFKPDVVVNAAAYTAVDKAENEIELAFLINETASLYLASACAKQDIPMIHVSTDYVFDGTASSPYFHDDKTAPQCVYGRSKLAGEKAIQSVWQKHIILRTSWVFSEYGSNFVKTILRLAQEKTTLNVVADQQGCPTYAGDLALAIIKICEQIDSGKSAWGVYHYCGDLATNWYLFAKSILNIAALPLILNPIATEQYPTPARRPQYSVMDCRHTTEVWGVSLSDWSLSLNRVIKLLM